MANYPSSGSTLRSNISTGLSTQILVKVNTETVGAIQKLSIAHTRNLNRVKELGLDGILEIVPDQATTYDITVSRIVFDRLSLPEAFSRGFINIKSQLLPFEILIIDRTNGENDGLISHRLINCWFSRFTTNYDTGSYIVMQDATIFCEDITSTLGGTDANAATGGSRGINYQVDTFGRERATDRGSGGVNGGGGFRGTLDVANIVNAAFED